VTNTYDRRQFLTHSAAAAGGVVAAGAVAAEELGFTGIAAAAGANLNVGVISDQSLPFSPQYAHMDTTGFLMARTIYDPLLVVSSDGKTVYPYLAKSITHNATYTAWTMAVRPGVKFHNGDPCNAAAIAANLKGCLSSYLTGPAVRSLISAISSTASTVTVHTKHPWVTFPYTLAEQQISFIAHPKTISSSYKGNPIGTGPFVFSSYTPGVSPWVAVKNTQYWRKGLPYLGSVTMNVQPDGPTRYASLKSGVYDIIVEGEGDVIKDYPSLGAGYTYTSDFAGMPGGAKPVYLPSCNMVMFNCTKVPLALRKACSYAINPATFIADIDSGLSTAINGLYPAGTPYYKNPPYPKFNLSTAISLVNKIPAAQRKFKLNWVQGSLASQNFATIVQSQLAAAGVAVDISTSIKQQYFIDAAIYGTYEALTWAQFGGVEPDLNYPWFSTQTGGTLLGSPFTLNFARNLNPKIQNAMLAGMAAKTTSARVAAWASVNTMIDQAVPYLWTDRSVIGVAAHANITNWKTFKDPVGHAILQPNQGVFFCTEVKKS
jgi:peptide/nickel transport system substrate-binding protein